MTAATISIVCHNNIYHTKRCIEAVYRWSKSFNLIITDNASRDGTSEYLSDLAAEKGNIRIVRNTENLGFSEPNRKAYSLATGTPYFVTLNNDYVIQGEWLEPMIARLQSNPRMAIVGVRGSCCGLTEDLNGFPAKSVEYIEASCMMVKRSIIDTLEHGLFSPYLRFAYGEDSDLSLRAREAGYFISMVEVPHIHEHATTAKLAAYRYYVGLNQEANHAALSIRWKAYLKRRNFNYSVLIIRHESNGDVLFVTPILDALKKKWPACSITIQTNHPDIFDNHPFAFATQQKLDKDDFDFVFDLDLAYENRPYLHSVEAYSDVCGVTLPTSWKYRLYPGEISDAKPDGDIVAFHVGPTTWPGKNWDTDRFEQVADWFRSKGYAIATVGNRSNYLLRDSIDKRGITISETARFLFHCKRFVGVDSFPAHIAEAMGCKTTIICGALDARMRSISNTTVISARPEDAPCALELHRLPPPRVDAPCDGACMKSISVERVLEELNGGYGL